MCSNSSKQNCLNCNENCWVVEDVGQELASVVGQASSVFGMASVGFGAVMNEIMLNVTDWWLCDHASFETLHLSNFALTWVNLLKTTTIPRNLEIKIQKIHQEAVCENNFCSFSHRLPVWEAALLLQQLNYFVLQLFRSLDA